MGTNDTTRDTSRLEILFERGWTVCKLRGRYRIEGSIPITDWMDSPRAALDEAMRLDKEFAASSLTLEESLSNRRDGITMKPFPLR